MTYSSTVPLARPDALFIDGTWRESASDRRITVVSPHDESVAATVAAADAADAQASIAAARRAFDSGPWPRMTPRERAEHLARMGEHLRARSDDLARAYTLQVGALASVAPFLVGGGLQIVDDVVSYADTFDWVREDQPTDGQGKALIVREPLGTVAAIAPWNAPFTIMLNKVMPALLAGNSVIMKPAPETPIEAFIIAEAAAAAGLPAGVLNLLPADRDVANELVVSDGIDKVSFTGSTAAGRQIGAICGGRIGRCTLELGGKSAAVVLDDYDVETAARTLAFVISMFSGQICASLTRAIVPKRRYGDFVEAIGAAMAAIRVGDPTDPASQMGPLAMARQLETVRGYIDRGTREGARLVTGGERPAGLDRGHYLAPTLFADVDSGHGIAQEEIFGPVLSLIAAEDEADAIRIANDSRYGLYGAVFTDDVDAAYRVARGIRAGAVTQNAFKMDPRLPFGGFKQSGIGREGGLVGLAGYTDTKTLLLDALPSTLVAGTR
ncbi:MAG: aldehyde dehydrogenase [Sphingomonas hengshuiensis]|uniref:Aldehyde dehydrogenase n=1 Tax=Sphingomonas hengshuiensis TaxID=1609977 RepID=A0A2W5BGY4_9SPHN|nr:MAG: aldehyde dehydrogenase [Sphingomonas hengshuiensis]